MATCRPSAREQRDGACQGVGIGLKVKTMLRYGLVLGLVATAAVVLCTGRSVLVIANTKGNTNDMPQAPSLISGAVGGQERTPIATRDLKENEQEDVHEHNARYSTLPLETCVRCCPKDDGGHRRMTNQDGDVSYANEGPITERRTAWFSPPWVQSCAICCDDDDGNDTPAPTSCPPVSPPTPCPTPPPTPVPMSCPPVSPPTPCPTPPPTPPPTPLKCDLPICAEAPACLETFDDLLNATLNAGAGDVIAICDGTSINTTQQLVLGADADNVTLCCQGSNDCTLRRTGNTRFRILTVRGDDFKMCGLNLENGDFRGVGGNLRIVSGGDHLIINSKFNGGNTDGNGGNVYVAQGPEAPGSITFRDCLVSDGRANQGAGVFISNVLRVKFENTEFSNKGESSTSADIGGGLFLSNVYQAEVLSCVFEGNSVDDNGAGFFADDVVSFIVDASIFNNNTAIGFTGGAGFIDSSVDSYLLIDNMGMGNMDDIPCEGFFDDATDSCLFPLSDIWSRTP